MPIVTVAKARRKTNSRGRRPTKARDAALLDQIERAFTASWATGVRRLKGAASTQRMADAYYSKDYASVAVHVPFEKFNDYLAEAIGELARATTLGGSVAAKSVPDLGALRYDLTNPRVVDYLQARTGALISGVTDDFQVSVQQMVAGRLGGTTDTQGLARDIGRELRGSIGLDPVSAGALRNAAASGKFVGKDLDAYEQRLLDRRAENIARTETAYATNAGQMAVWESAKEQGLLEEGASKVWICDARPCEDCAPMDGLMVGLDEEFLAPSGVRVLNPPLHPRCRCAISMSPDGEEIDAPHPFGL